MKKFYLITTFILIGLVSIAQPIYLGNHWYNNGPNTAFVAAMEMATSDPNIIYLGAFNGIIYKSEDKGVTWSQCSTEGLLDYVNYPVSMYHPGNRFFGAYHVPYSITINPSNPQELYIILYGGKCLKSINGGNSWENYTNSFGDTALIGGISFDPRDEDKRLMYLKNGNDPYITGIYNTNNGGQTWTRIEGYDDFATEQFNSFYRNPYFPDIIYASFKFNFYKSVDNGITWTEIPSGNVLYNQLFFDPEDDQKIWAIDNTMFLEAYIAHSEDGGYNWTYIDINHPTHVIQPWSLFMDNNQNIYFDNFDHVFFSSDLGNTLDTLPLFDDRGFNSTLNLQLSNSTFTDPTNDNKVFIGNAFGVNIFDNEAFTLTESTDQLNNAYIEDIAVSHSNINIAYAAGKLGLWKTEDKGLHWNRLATENFYQVKTLGANADTLFALAKYNIAMRSFDGGVTFDTLNENIIPEKIAIDYINRIVYAMDENILFKSFDFGNTWEQVVDFDNYDFPGFVEILIDPSNPNNIYIGRHRSADGGESWNLFFFDSYIQAIDPQHSNIVYASDSEGDNVYQSTNWGITLNKIFDSDTLNGTSNKIKNINIDPNDSSYIYFGTLLDGIIYSHDFGETWQRLPGQYNDRAYEIIPRREENSFYIATFGEGVWVYDSAYTAIPETTNFTSRTEELMVYPNPVKNTIYLQTELSGIGTISIYNIQGQMIMQTVKNFAKGQSSELHLKDAVTQGVYFIAVEINGKVLSRKFLVEDF